MKASDIARFLDEPLIGPDIDVTAVRPVHRLTPGALGFAGRGMDEVTPEAGALVLIRRKADTGASTGNSFIRVDRPREAFARVVAAYFEARPAPGIAPSARIAAGAEIGPDAVIGDCVVIEDGARVGARVRVAHNTTIFAGTLIGDDCRIGAGTVIGDEGLGADFDAEGRPVRIPHLGRVEIGEGVVIGPGNTIARGTIEDTVIGDHTMTGPQVNVAHNAVIGRDCIIAGHAQISGSVRIGNRCWLGPGCAIHQTRVIGDRAKIGMGAVVIEDVPPSTTVMGLEGLPIERLYTVKRTLGYK